MKKVLFLLLILALTCSSCETFEQWLFNASDYHLIESKNNNEEDFDWEDIYWDDADYEIWYDELEYD
ncbi:MAG: hypothetical protein MJZ57_06710 [Bacteroidales bacterium]|nr:hypothetical protein [Bacteroidales bacterium]